MPFLSWLPILEAFTLAASLLGLFLSIVTGKAFYALVPIVLSLLLNQWNRRQGDLRNRQGSIVALRRARQELTEELQVLQQNLQRQSVGALSQLHSAQDLELAIAQIRLQNARLDASLKKVVQALNQFLPTPVELLEPEVTQAAPTPSPVTSTQIADPLWQEALRWQRGLHLVSHQGWVNAIALSPDGQQLATGGNDQQIRFWQVQTGESLGNCTSSGPISALGFSPDGRTLASGNYDHRIQLWSVADQSLIKTLEGHQGSVQALIFVTDPGTLDRCLISGSYDQSLRFWDLETGEADRLTGHEGSVQCLSLDTTQWRLASGGEEGQIRLWKLPDGELIRVLSRENSAIESLALSSDGKYLAGGCSDGSLHLWQLDTYKLLYTLEAHTGPVTALVITPDGRTLLSGGADGRLKLWKLANGQAWGNLAEPVDAILNLAISQDGTLLVSSHPGGKVQFWHWH
jgi:WD40 repeat protein